MRAACLVIVLCGCGRLGFGDHPDATNPSVADGSDGGATDGRDADTADAVPPDVSNVAKYSMDNLTSAMKLLDLSGFGNVGSCTGAACPTVGAGEIAGALVFDGVEDIIRVPSSVSLTTASALTVAAWFNTAALAGTAYHCLVNKPLAGGVADSWQLCVTDTSTLFAAMRDGAAQDVSVLGTTPFPANTWEHGALTWDGAMLTMYLNGVSGGGVGITSIDLDGSPVTIGSDIDDSTLNAEFQGSIDDVRIYNRALTASEIAQLAAE